MGNNVIHAVRLADLSKVAPALGVWRCEVCGNAGSADTLGAIVMRDGQPRAICANPSCTATATGFQDDE